MAATDNKDLKFTKITSTDTKGNLALSPNFVSNDANLGKKVISSVEDGLKHCDSFCISVAFITMSGITPLKPILKYLEENKIPGRILTTDYLTFSDPKALKFLSKFSNLELRMYVTDNEINTNKNEGFHTKGYIFKSDESYQIIIGSSNLTQSALTTNKEWNTAVSLRTDAAFVSDVLNEFETLWGGEFTYSYDKYKDLYEQKYRLIKAQQKAAVQTPVLALDTYKLKPNRMQNEFIDNLKELLDNGAKRALLISATGTGKTYASAFALREIKAKKALFVVHREQIAKQAQKSFDIIFNQQKSSCILSGNNHEVEGKDLIFSTVQTLSKDETLKGFKEDEFDVIVIDEAHHVGAPSYQKVLNYFKPRLCLGMTASPERSDDIDIYETFDHNIAYEIRLQQALEHDFLCPFHYFGISDFQDLEHEVIDLNDFRYLASEDRFAYIVEQIKYYGYCGDKVHGLIFVSRREEAVKLSEYLNTHTEFKTCVLTGADSQEQRDKMVELLEREDTSSDYLDYIISVDIFNEGVDIPIVNQVVMLRPTTSPIVFVQQLGRGLRKYNLKEYVVILDFIGNYQNNYMVPMALSGDRSYDKENLRRYVQTGERIIPGASTIHFDEITKKRIYESIDSTNFSDLKLLRDSYKELKQKIGRIPNYFDFEKYGQIDVQCFFRNKTLKGSYHNFLTKYDKEYKVSLNENECEYLSFASQYFGNGKRDTELLLLKYVLDSGDHRNDVFRSYERDHGALTQVQKVNLANILSNNFITGTGKGAYNGLKFFDLEGPELVPNKTFVESLNHPEFKKAFSQIVDYALYKYQRDFAAFYECNLVLYKRYSYADVCRLINWDKSVVALNIGGYKYDEPTNTLPIFVNYNKDDSISASIKYEDRFINNQQMTWISKSKVNLDNNVMKLMREEETSHVQMYLFVRKNNSTLKLSETNTKTNKETAKEFYYLGKVHLEPQSQELITMKNDEGNDLCAVKMVLNLEHYVRDDIYDYLVNQRRKAIVGFIARLVSFFSVDKTDRVKIS